jgi:hypothetical protein
VSARAATEPPVVEAAVSDESGASSISTGSIFPAPVEDVFTVDDGNVEEIAADLVLVSAAPTARISPAVPETPSKCVFLVLSFIGVSDYCSAIWRAGKPAVLPDGAECVLWR